MTLSKEQILRTLFLTLFFGIILLGSYSYALQQGGFDKSEILQKFFFYSTTLFIVSLIIFASYLISQYMDSRDDEYGDGIGYSEIGSSPALEIFENYSMLQLSWLSAIVFLGMGILNFALRPFFPFLQESYSGVLILQQFSILENNIFSLLLVPLVETIWAVAVISVIITIVRVISIKYDFGEFNFRIASIIIGTIGLSILGYLWHFLVYPENDLIRFIGSGFWAFGGLITILTGFAVPFWILHIVNNVIVIFAKFFSSDLILISLVAVEIVLTLGYIALYRGDSLRGINS